MRLLLILFSAVPLLSLGQVDVGLKGGINIPNLANIGIFASTERFDFGFDYGSAPVELIYFYSISTNASYHFGERINLTKESTWYLKSNYTYNYEESSKAIRYNNFLGVTGGRKWKFENRFSLSFDIGITGMIYHKKILKEPSTWDIEVYPKILPSGGLTLYYSIYRFNEK